MAIYQGGRGMAFQGGGNSMFSQLSETMQRAQEIKQADREQAFLDKINANANAMGKISTDFYDSFQDGHMQVGSSKSWKQHYDELSKGKRKAREMRRAFGRDTTPQQIQDFFKNKTNERDMEIVSAIERRMTEMGTDDIWKVVPKIKETGGENFHDWYKNITDDNLRQRLMTLGYVPGQKNEAWVPDWMEARKAQGKSATGVLGPALVGTGYLGYKGLQAGKRYATQKGQAAYKKFIKGDEGKELRELYGKDRSFREAQKKLSSERAKLKKEIGALNKKGNLNKTEQNNLKAKQKRITAIDAEKKKMINERSKFSRARNEKLQVEEDRLRDEFKKGQIEAGKKGALNTAKGIGVGLLGSMGGGKLLGSVTEAIGGEDYRILGEIAGGIGGPSLIAKYGPRAAQLLKLAGKAGAGKHWVGTGLGALAYGAGSLLDAALND
tara:strand:+ start:6610 stop:7926 length:1317 start_codon:yes stop_codon:yes gene_type:complete